MIATLLGAIAVLAAAVGGLLYRSGRASTQSQQLKDKTKKSERMRDAASNVDRRRGGILDRLRKGKF